MIIVTGATGKLGRAIVRQLVRHVPVTDVGVSVRDPGGAGELSALGVRVRRGDFDSPDTLAQAFAGATQLLIVSSNARAYGGDPLAQHRTAIDAARAAGVRRILYTSHMAASDASAFPPARDHAATEAMLATSGMAWTALRHGFYAESAFMLMGGFDQGVIAAPRDGKVSWTTHADLAAADAAVLADEGCFEGPTPPLIGAAALDLDDLAAIAAEVSGQPVRRKEISAESLRAMMTERGAPEAAVGTTLALFAAARAGEFAAVDPTLARLIGRAPMGMREVIADKLG